LFWSKFIDIDQDGFASVKEIMRIQTLFDDGIELQNGTDRWLQRWVLAFDRNMDRRVSRSEFVNRLTDLPIGPTTPAQIHTAYTNSLTSLVFMWVTDNQTASSTVKYGTESGQYSNIVQGISYTYDVGILGGWHKWMHLVNVTNLSQSMLYYYIVGDEQGGWSEEYHISTPLTNATRPIRFMLAGDMGTVIPLGFAVAEQMRDYAALNPVDMVLHLGDIAYGGTEAVDEYEPIWDIWADQVQSIATNQPYMVTVGNHEQYYNWTAFRSRFRMPGWFSGGYGGNESFWWSMDYTADIHITSMSSEEDYSVGSPQYLWLQSDLAQAQQRRLQRGGGWIFVLRHRPTYNDQTAEWQAGDAVLEPLYNQYKVDLVLCGHIHSYQRTYPVLAAKSFPQESLNVAVDPPAPIYIMQADSGAYIAHSWHSPTSSWLAVKSDSYGFGVMTIYNTTHLYYQKFGLDRDVLDALWLIKSS